MRQQGGREARRSDDALNAHLAQQCDDCRRWFRHPDGLWISDEVGWLSMSEHHATPAPHTLTSPSHPLRRARIRVETRQQALLEQDIAAEHSTMPYRAPELFDVKTGQTLDEKVDIWVRKVSFLFGMEISVPLLNCNPAPPH